MEFTEHGKMNESSIKRLLKFYNQMSARMEGTKLDHFNKKSWPLAQL